MDWSLTPPRPSFLGVRVFEDYPLPELVERIDWTPFFATWELRGAYPAILDDPRVGPTARDLHRDALALLDRIVAERLFRASAVVGFWPANATPDDDIVLWTDESRTTEAARIHALRQQMAKPDGRPNVSVADFVGPAGVADYVGGFAVTAGHGVGELVREFEAANDDYSAILAKALADRLAEAFAERLHERVRRELWGYAADEALSNEDLIRERYQGIRPAPGYPATPDHRAKSTLFELLDAHGRAGIELTESLAMLPAASVSGHLPVAPGIALLRDRPDGPRPAGGLRPSSGDPGRGGRAMAGAEPRGRGGPEPGLTMRRILRHTMRPVPLPGSRTAPRIPLARRLAPLAALALAAVLAAGVAPAPAEGATRDRYRMNLGTRQDWVQQTNFVQCVGTSIQMMLNIIEPGRDRTVRTQRRLQELARAWSGPSRTGNPRRGASVRGWAASLVVRGAGAYRVVGADSLQQAMQVAAEAIREYRRPVGLLVWSGRHAWVMTGFEATGDPLLAKRYRVTKAYILDPLYPYGDDVWGPSPTPGAAIPVATVGRQFVKRVRRGSSWNNLPGAALLRNKWVLVVPTGQIRPGIE